ncbi:MAG: sugar ABC transporter ATP-binding protein [Rhodospirillales bacterium]|nr:sugar ABC transporter ATP-binding protein [Rhodospirillales bacterium]
MLAIVGENGAGKSTLLNILSGVIRPDGGVVRIDGSTVEFDNPREAQSAGIGTVFQELSLVPVLSVAENIFPNRAPLGGVGFIDWPRLYERTTALLSGFNVQIDPARKVGDLPISTRQIVEIAKALSLDSRILLLDEPTSALTPDEIEALFTLIRALTAKGIAVIYISHHMSEIFEISDRVLVLRDGKRAAIHPTASVSREEVIKLMVGRDIGDMFLKRSSGIGAELLRSEKLGLKGKFGDVDISLCAGEIVGIAGLMGSHRSELAEVLAGVRPRDSGQLFIDGKVTTFNHFADAIDRGIAYLPAERKTEGLFLEKSIADNISATVLASLSVFGIMKTRLRDALALSFVERLRIKSQSILQSVCFLSGGNQQKVLLAKWLATNPRILIIDEPTKGVDVGSKAEIHALLRDLAENGAGILIVSSDMPEMIGLCDRLVVMCEGKISGHLSAEEATEESIIFLATGMNNPSEKVA